jgi:glycerophosphoryl diester phosphodiesterase
MQASAIQLLQDSVDAYFALLPRARPLNFRRPIRLVAHRGNTGEPGAAKENTMSAFKRCQQLGVWGIEFDIQWTADGVPVVIHDDNTARVFASPALTIAETRFAEIRQKFPLIPSLDEVINEFSRSLHFMVELKNSRLTTAQQQTLKKCFASLEPATDYHYLSLNCVVFDSLSEFPPACFMAVSETNTQHIVKQALSRKLGSVSGHYLLFSQKLREQCRAENIGLGMGFIANRKPLYRELSLASDWAFTNHAAMIQYEVDQLTGAG